MVHEKTDPKIQIIKKWMECSSRRDRADSSQADLGAITMDFNAVMGWHQTSEGRGAQELWLGILLLSPPRCQGWEGERVKHEQGSELKMHNIIILQLMCRTSDWRDANYKIQILDTVWESDNLWFSDYPFIAHRQRWCWQVRSQKRASGKLLQHSRGTDGSQGRD